MTAGRGIEGAGEAERRYEGAGEELPPKDDRLLCEEAGGGGFMGRASIAGVPGAEGAEGAGEAAVVCEAASDNMRPRLVKSGGAGLFEVLRLGGISILVIRPYCDREN